MNVTTKAILVAMVMISVTKRVGVFTLRPGKNARQNFSFKGVKIFFISTMTTKLYLHIIEETRIAQNHTFISKFLQVLLRYLTKTWKSGVITPVYPTLIDRNINSKNIVCFGVLIDPLNLVQDEQSCIFGLIILKKERSYQLVDARFEFYTEKYPWIWIFRAVGGFHYKFMALSTTSCGGVRMCGFSDVSGWCWIFHPKIPAWWFTIFTQNCCFVTFNIFIAKNNLVLVILRLLLTWNLNIVFLCRMKFFNMEDYKSDMAC